MFDQRITETFVELADTLVLGFDGIDFLHTLTERCVQLLDVDAAGILLVDQWGTLNLVAASTEQARTPTAIPADATAVAQSFANVATISILQTRALHHSEMVTEQLQTALNSRILLEQTKGILAERRHISLTEAFTLMRAYARDHNRPHSQIAKAVITHAPDITDLTTSPTRPQ